jgi:hypothetical protein
MMRLVIFYKRSNPWQGSACHVMWKGKRYVAYERLHEVLSSS